MLDTVCAVTWHLWAAVTWAVVGTAISVAVVAYNWGYDNGKRDA